MGHQVGNVPRYFEPYVNDCFAAAYGAILSHMGLNPKIILNDYLSFMYDKETGFIGTNYLHKYTPSVEFTEEELNTSLEFAYFPQTTYYREDSRESGLRHQDRIRITMYIHDDSDKAETRLKELIDLDKPVMALVDLYHMNYHKAYRKEHGLHAVVITGYDEDQGTYSLFDKYKLSDSDFDGELRMEDVRESRVSDVPRENPVTGVYRRPIRNLWVEAEMEPGFQISEEKIRNMIEISCRRMTGQKELLGFLCGLEALNAFRKDFYSKKEQPLDELGIYLFKTYFNISFKRISRSRKRFSMFLQEVNALLPQDLVSELSRDLEESEKRWGICANLSLKLGISKKMNLMDDMDKHLQAIEELEARIVENLAKCLNTHSIEEDEKMSVDINRQMKEVFQEIAVGFNHRELADDILLADLGIDSMKYVELLVQMEEKCEVVFDESDLGAESIRSIGDLSALIQKTIARQAS